MKIDIEPKFYNAVIDRYLEGDFGIDFKKKKFFDLDSEELNLLGTFQNNAKILLSDILMATSKIILKIIKLPKYTEIFTIKLPYMKQRNYLAREVACIST